MPVRPWQSPLSDSTAGSGPYQGRALRREWCQDGLPLLKSPIKVRWVTDGSQMGHRWVTDGSQMGHRWVTDGSQITQTARCERRQSLHSGWSSFKKLWWGWGWWLWWWLWWWWGPVQRCACGTSMPFLKAFWRSPLLYQPSAWGNVLVAGGGWDTRSGKHSCAQNCVPQLFDQQTYQDRPVHSCSSVINHPSAAALQFCWIFRM